MACKMRHECPLNLFWLYSFSFIAYVSQPECACARAGASLCRLGLLVGITVLGLLGATVQLPKGSGAQWHLFS